MKHISHFVSKGAYLLNTEGTAADNTLTFVNPDNSVIVLMVETEGKNRILNIEIGKEKRNVEIKANSINTFCFK